MLLHKVYFKCRFKMFISTGTILKTLVKLTTRYGHVIFKLPDEYSMFPQSYSMGIHGYILVFSVTSEKSFEVIKVIHEKLLDLTGQNRVPLVLVGNKTDLHMERTITTEAGKQLANTWKAIFLETSAKEHKSVEQVFYAMLNEIEKQEVGPPEKKDDCNIL